VLGLLAIYEILEPQNKKNIQALLSQKFRPPQKKEKCPCVSDSLVGGGVLHAQIRPTYRRLLRSNFQVTISTPQKKEKRPCVSDSLVGGGVLHAQIRPTYRRLLRSK